MPNRRLNCLPYPNRVSFTQTPHILLPATVEWGSCPPHPFIESLLLQIHEVPGGRIWLHLDPLDVQSSQLDEGYELHINSTGTHLCARTQQGLMYGAITLLQSHQRQDLQGLEAIHDNPRFGWRGLLIDPARHFLSIELLERIIDGMALMKLNVLHLHLTDDQAFRFESRVFPKLQAKQHYTQQALKSLVDYADQRGVRIVPEIDIPGHVNAWLAAYPEWGVKPVTQTHRFGGHRACLDPTDDAVYEALEQIFTEVTKVFSDPYVHIGGDEVNPSWWSEDPKIQTYMQTQGLHDVRSLQNHFTIRIVEMLSRMGKTAIGWDEVLHSDMPEMVVQNWRGMTTRDRIGAQGLPCIVSAPFYLDLNYPADLHYAFDLEMPQNEAIALEDRLRKDPRLAHVAQGIEWTLHWRDQANSDNPSTKVLGGEACLWSEIVDEQTLETRLWSRLPAIAERLWTVEADPDFERRLDQLLQSPPFALALRQASALRGIGLTAEQIDIALLLEPVKWYGRLLGTEAIRARIAGNEMPKSRPYQVDTPLNRVIDFIAPESRSAVQLGKDSDIAWQHLARQVLDQDLTQWPEDTQPVLEAFQTFANHILAGNREAAKALYQPFGEYLIAAIPAWLARPPKQTP